MEYQLLWSEDFSPTENKLPDSRTWTFDIGDGTAQGIPGWGNQEREFYTDRNAFVDSSLVLTANKTDMAVAPEAYYGKAEWLSSKIHTAGKVSFQYGRFDFEVQTPVGGGSWPAIWMLGENINEVTWPHCGEIDIFEGAGNRPKEVRGTLHGPGYCADSGITGAYDEPSDLAQSIHKFSIEWLPDHITWFADTKPYLTIRRSDIELSGKHWPFNERFYLIINLAMGGWFAGPIAEGFDSCTFRVISIKHYSIDGVGSVF